MLPSDVLYLFEDGDWHSVKDVARKFQVTIQQAESVIQLLEAGGFIQFDRRQSRAIIKVGIQRILSEIRDDEAMFGESARHS